MTTFNNISRRFPTKTMMSSLGSTSCLAATLMLSIGMLGGAAADHPTAPDVIEKNAALVETGGMSRLAEKLDEDDTAMVSAALAHSLAQLKVKRRQRH